MRAKLHPGLTQERWSSFPLPQRLLMVANELNRAEHWLGREDREEGRRCLARTLELADLTAETIGRGRLLKEFLRWRELLADEFNREDQDPARCRSLQRVLVALEPESYNALAGSF